MLKWMLLFISVPVAEVIIYIVLGKYIGLLPTLTLIFGTGIAGAILAKQQGFSIISRIRGDLQAGVIPGNHVLEGLLVFVGALLLLTPGLLSDITGFVLLWPFTRRYLRERLRIKLRKWIDEGRVNFDFRIR